MTDRELMQQAFERMTGVSGAWTNPAFMQSRNGFIQGWEAGASDLRERLAQPVRTHWEGCEEVHPQCKQPEQEPVAWLYRDAWGTMKLSQVTPPPVGAFPVYTAPPQRKPLTDEEIERACVPLGAAMLSFTEVARAIEAAHGIKENT